MTTVRAWLLVGVGFLAAACGDDGAPRSADAGAADAAGGPDAGPSDAGPDDAGPTDIGRADAGLADAAATDLGPRDAGSARATTYYVVRHTERDPGRDPPINAEGRARAERLADALARAGVDEIVTTQFIRGQQSGEPLADRTGAPITVAPIEPTAWSAFGTAVGTWQREREVPGRTYVLIGHSSGYNTSLLRALGAPGRDTLAERYQDLVVLIREPEGDVRLAVLQYGGPSSLDP